MFVTTSRKGSLLEKKFSKYLAGFLPGLTFLPRGKTPLLDFFSKARYLGHPFFLKVASIGSNVLLSVYIFKEDSFFLEKEFLLEVIDLRHLRPFSYFSSVSFSFRDSDNFFYFLPKKNKSIKSFYGVFLDPQRNIFEFLENGVYLGFSFRVLKVSLYD